MPQKYYFKEKDDANCYPIAEFLQQAKEEGKAEITLFAAVRDRSMPAFAWCAEYESAVERTSCNKQCGYYVDNEDTGVCESQCDLYHPAEAVTINVATGRCVKACNHG